MRIPEEGPVPPDRSKKPEQTPRIKDSWIQALVDGYALWPERLTPGMSILVTDAVLKDPPVQWDDFLTSPLPTPKGIDIASALQRHTTGDEPLYSSDSRGIPDISYLPEATRDQEEPHFTTLQQIQLLWADLTDIVGKTIEDIIDPQQYPDKAERERRFRNPDVVAKIPQALPTVAAAKAILLSNEGLELAEIGKLADTGLLSTADERHRRLLEKYARLYEERDPYEERRAMFEPLGLRAMTADEIFSPDNAHLSLDCAKITADLIAQSIKSAHLPPKISGWMSY